MDFLYLVDNTNLDNDFELFPTYVDSELSRKRQISPEPSEQKRQRLDETESIEIDDYVELLTRLINEKEQTPIEENSYENFQTFDASERTLEQSTAGVAEESADKSNSGSIGRQICQLKVVGRPLREKPPEPKKVKKPVVPNYENQQEDIPVKKQDILQELLTIQPKNVTLSVKMIETNKSQDTKICSQTDFFTRDIKPQPLKLRFIDSQTPVLAADLQPQNQVVCKQLQPTIQMAQTQMVNIPRPTQGTLSVPHGARETIVFDPSRLTLKKVQNENFPDPNIAMPCKNLKIVSMPLQNTVHVSRGKAQPMVQQPVKSFVTKHKVVLKSTANLPPHLQKVFTLVPHQPVKGNRLSQTSTGGTFTSVLKPRKIVLKTRNDSDIVSAEDFARFIARRGL